MRPPPSRDACVECGKPFRDSEHRGVQTHLYRRADGLSVAHNTPPRPSVDEMATQMLSDTANQSRVPVQELAAAVGQAMGVAMLSPGMSMAKLAAAQRRAGATFEQAARGVLVEERFDPVKDCPRCPRDPKNKRRHRTRRHRRFPCAAWKRRCRCHECHRGPDYARIEAMERECEIRNEEGELVWPPPSVGDRDEHGCTLVSIDAAGMCIWDRPHPPGPPPRDPGRAQWV